MPPLQLITTPSPNLTWVKWSPVLYPDELTSRLIDSTSPFSLKEYNSRFSSLSWNVFSLL